MNLVKDISSNAHWISDANCKNMDTDLFFVEVNKSYDPFVKEVCSDCSVIEKCAWYANEMSAIHGVFGGMTPNQREKWRKKNKIILGESRENWEVKS